jgi:bile acid:Na+ symporter, BASS family
VQDSPLIDIGLPAALFIIMVGIGLTLTVADFARERRAPRAAIVGTVGQLVAMPALAFLIAWALSLPPAVTIGLVVSASCPGGTTSNVIAYLGRANVALSIVLTVVSSIAIIFTLPFWTNLALGWQPLGVDADVRVPVADTVGLLVVIVLVPVAIGMFIRQRNPWHAAKLERIVSLLGAIVLAALIVGIALSVRDQIGELVAASGPAAFLLNVGGVAVGIAIGALTGLGRTDQLTLGIELGVKNSTLGILIALNVIGSEAVGFTAAVYGLVMYISAVGLVVAGRRMLSGEVDKPDDALTPSKEDT